MILTILFTAELLQLKPRSAEQWKTTPVMEWRVVRATAVRRMHEKEYMKRANVAAYESPCFVDEVRQIIDMEMLSYDDSDPYFSPESLESRASETQLCASMREVYEPKPEPFKHPGQHAYSLCTQCFTCFMAKTFKCTECPICLETRKIQYLKCGHGACGICMSSYIPWNYLSTKCFSCRRPVQKITHDDLNPYVEKSIAAESNDIIGACIDEMLPSVIRGIIDSIESDEIKAIDDFLRVSARDLAFRNRVRDAIEMEDGIWEEPIARSVEVQDVGIQTEESHPEQVQVGLEEPAPTEPKITEARPRPWWRRFRCCGNNRVDVD